MVHPAGWPRFFVRVVVGLAGRPCFFVGTVMGLAVGLSKADSLAIGKAVLTGADVTVGFFGLFLW